MDKLTYFVPVDFSDCSYNAVQYATLLAKMFNGKVQLFHVADARNIAESDNPVVVMRSMDQLVEKAVSRMHSFCEMISETWQLQVNYSVTAGNVGHTLLNEIKNTKPDVIVFGKNKKGCYLLKKMLANTNIPVFVIPASARIQEPTNIILTMDMNNLRSEVLLPVVELVQKTSQPLSLLHVPPGNKLNGKAGKQWAEQVAQKFNCNITILKEEEQVGIHNILGQIQAGYADLLCTVKRQKRFFPSLFTDKFPTKLALQSKVPTLVITEKG